LNIDYVYSVDSTVKPGETIRVNDRQVFCGGKGLNQSIALANAAADVYHAGLIGQDGTMLLDALGKAGVNTSLVRMVEGGSSHAIIQVDRSGQNSILFYPGDNLKVTGDFIDDVLSKFEKGDYLLLQNEVDNTQLIIKMGHEKGLKVVFNPSPIQESIKNYPLHLVDIFVLNEIEGSMLSGRNEPEEILYSMMNLYPDAHIVLTLGEKGALYGYKGQKIFQPAYKAQAVDTTAAGDTFTGFFLAAFIKGNEVKEALDLAARAAAICVSRKGAAPSIPKLSELV